MSNISERNSVKDVSEASTRYASSTWDPYKEDIQKLGKVQGKAAWFCMKNYSRFSSATEMLEELKWETLETKRKKPTNRSPRRKLLGTK